MRERYIVAEISKNWPETQPLGLSETFERVLNRNHERGYRLIDWKLDRWSPEPGLLNETIIAVFERVGEP